MNDDQRSLEHQQKVISSSFGVIPFANKKGSQNQGVQNIHNNVNIS